MELVSQDHQYRYPSPFLAGRSIPLRSIELKRSVPGHFVTGSLALT